MSFGRSANLKRNVEWLPRRRAVKNLGHTSVECSSPQNPSRFGASHGFEQLECQSLVFFERFSPSGTADFCRRR